MSSQPPRTQLHRRYRNRKGPDHRIPRRGPADAPRGAVRLEYRFLEAVHPVLPLSHPGYSRNLEEKSANNESISFSPEPRSHRGTRHCDGTMNALQRGKALRWLKSDAVPEDECRIVTNVRCLPEGVDVPALDAVIFMNPRNSQVDVVQSIGRVMRKSEGKTYSYITLPISIPATRNPPRYSTTTRNSRSSGRSSTRCGPTTSASTRRSTPRNSTPAATPWRARSRPATSTTSSSR